MPVFKYFTMAAHARAFMNRGELLLRPLSYFRTHEDGGVRGDSRDGVLTYAPPSGLEIIKQDGTVVPSAGWRFTSSPKHDDIFVYCASNQLSAELAQRFASPFCVEIQDPDLLVNRLRARAHPTSRLDYDRTHSGSVEYRNLESTPGADWALPEKLAFIKPEGFAWQDEFRIAIGKRGAFDAENVECKIETGPAPSGAASYTQPALALRLGDLAHCTQLHRL